MEATFFILSVFILSSIPSWCFEPLNHEVEALIRIKSALNDPHGVLNNWDGDSVDPCSWSMITCSSENLVIGLGAPSQNLSGFLSKSIENLTNLRQILLQNNNISGEIPSELGNLSKLQTLDLSNNKFSGIVPEWLGQLSSLQYLRLNNNSLSGAFPASLSKIPQLAFLDLSYNNLSGPVPKFPARTFNIVGNPLICGNGFNEDCFGTTIPAALSFSLESSQRKSHTQKVAVAVGVSLGSISIILFPFLFMFCYRRIKQRTSFISDINETQEGGLINLGNLRQFTFRELQYATNSFSPKNLLGRGGFGTVYKGVLGDGTVVAVKRLKDMGYGGGGSPDLQFRTELEMISLAVHRNLLRLLGFCATAGERILVYPYMSNGSVASRLRGKPPLDWNTRKRIAVGSARGLLYLHEQCDPKIIHRDVKAANVLLDDFCEAVIGDFGLAKLLDHGDSHVTTAVRGTVGHIAPEYLSTGQSSEKTDVFGFGILLIELISGQRVLEFGKTMNQKGAMLDWVKKIHQEKKLDVLVDRELREDYDRIEVGELLQVAILCTQYFPADRPKMSEVVRMLEGDGLAEKWEAAQLRNKAENIGRTKHSPDGKSSGDGSRRAFIVIDDDNDDGSLDSQAMELSGPR